MFTGIVEELGVIKTITNKYGMAHFQISASQIISDAKVGDSISVNGCCLTITELSPYYFCCDLVPETLQRTSLGNLKESDKVNLERSVKLQDRLGGHIVQGHVDGIGKIQQKKNLGNGSWWITIKATNDILRYIIFKGSIAVDGVSLTIAEITDSDFSFAMIPHTAKVTTLGLKDVGDSVNLEVDMMAKYIERLLAPNKVNVP